MISRFGGDSGAIHARIQEFGRFLCPQARVNVEFLYSHISGLETITDRHYYPGITLRMKILG